ncbi:DEAD/DEAH box helicase [Pseudothermotoga sp.]|jgi:transcription-repair coupling factor (superfamily II helicase)|uniref:DEAD/DEAH box helicase n=1 Tax=Pseudothermotoga sp. TaxID=2033661 RepID=UPI0024AAA26E|nr:DEAD/DEAH box helicase [Pseudothermotoga sp.]MDI3494445.1 hypothetical protein [Pseudothermotoga sp.]MDK2884184.1 hypothetical protein [Pseudothermotoga sp.]
MRTTIDFLKLNLEKPVLIVVPTEYEAQLLSQKLNAFYFPSHDVFPFEEVAVSFEVRCRRIEILWKLLNDPKIVIVCTLHAISRKTFSPVQLRQAARILRKGEVFHNPEETMLNLGYDRTYIVRTGGEFSVRGDVIDFFGPLYDNPVRVELFDQTIEAIRCFDASTQRSVFKVEEAFLLPVREYLCNEHLFDTVPAKLGSNSTILDYSDFEIFVAEFDRCQEEFAKREREAREMLEKKQIEDYVENSQISFSSLVKRIEFFKPLEIDLNTLKILPQTSQKSRDQIPIFDEEELIEGEFVVHRDYGIGVYDGVKKISNPLGTREYFVLRYEDSTVYVPVERIHKIHKYIGDTRNVRIDRIHSGNWKKRIERVKRNLREKVEELIRIYDTRQKISGLSLPGDPELEKRFAEFFPYAETDDQMTAIEEVLSDLANDKPMDRLLCGDAGYGKTEVALRAAFKCVVSGKQVAVLVPTTVLARQHYKIFTQRMSPFGIQVRLLDRSISTIMKKEILDGLFRGEIDVIIGTHALLQNNVRFSDLGLVIIDEEQSFGVEQKEKFKQLRTNVNVLSLSATPIPRTLHMAMTGMKDLSVINTPPIGRLPVITYVAKYSNQLVRGAVLREINRGGQVIYVHNRIHDIQDVYQNLQHIIPEAKIVLAHGKMGIRKLTEAVRSFYEHDSDVILCTSILESGIDIPNANTIIVDDSHRYGLAQLYQLRGRVGRSTKRAFAYFLHDSEISEKALQRLQAIKQLTGSGSGFQLALRDMQIRGVGSVFGFEQHGNINDVGLNLYLEIMNHQLKGIKKEKSESRKLFVDTEMEGIPGELVIPPDYVESPLERMRIYRRFASCETVSEIDGMVEELHDRFGKLPNQALMLVELFKIRLLASSKHIRKIEYRDNILKLIYEKQPSLKFKGKFICNEREKTYFFYNVEPGQVVGFLKELLS